MFMARARGWPGLASNISKLPSDMVYEFRMPADCRAFGAGIFMCPGISEFMYF